MPIWFRVFPLALCLLSATASLVAVGQENSNQQPDSSIRILGPTPPLHMDPAKALFLQLENVGLDPARVYHVRDVALDRAAFHISLEDGVIGFTSDVAGKVTGAFFEGEGEILLTPPNQVERASMMLQTGAAILEERFATAYFRFNDDTFAELQPLLTSADNSHEFVSHWDGAARNLASGDALRLFMTFSKSLPSLEETGNIASRSPRADDRFLHALLQGETKGTFDVYFDSDSPEQVWAAQSRTVDGTNYYDVWTSFSFLPKTKHSGGANAIATEEGQQSALDISSCRIRAEINPPTSIEADALLDLLVRQGGQRAVLFELARTLVIRKVEADGQAVQFIHNPSIEGTQLARRGNDLVAVVFPAPVRAGQKIKLRFVYGGEVLSEAGPGLLYVGARGTWYPNRGLTMTNFDLEFHYPPGWTLVATGKKVDLNQQTDSPGSGTPQNSGEQASRWISERPIPFAGFNLGKYRRAAAHAGTVTVEAYGTAAVERGFPQAESQPTAIGPPPIIGREAPPLEISAFPPSPAHNVEMVAGVAAHAVDFYARSFGPYPYGELALTQMPGTVSQGWPGLVFLSSFSFLTAEQRSALHMDAVEKTLISTVIAHETAHQWWGDLVTWDGYRDQWISEGLANYSSMMLLQNESPRDFRAVMEKYRNDLLQKTKSGVPLMEDGPVTLGNRLSCSQFPQGYEAISYGRGTWLFHMLRTMMRDAERASERRDLERPDSENEPFLRALQHIRERYEGRPITTREMLQVFQEDLPRSLWYEGRKSLDWFYDGWVNGTAVPHFELRGVKFTEKGGQTIVSATILQRDAPKDLVTPVPVYASRGGKLILLGRIFADGPETPFHFGVPSGTRKIVVDPNETLLARTR
ncbi:MAG TPA: M1 family aminopeptidase [Terriglobales bacterium]|nr:M1 family aminopeptidase [Terriglobales bacterium]